MWIKTVYGDLLNLARATVVRVGNADCPIAPGASVNTNGWAVLAQIDGEWWRITEPTLDRDAQQELLKPIAEMLLSTQEAA